MTNGEYTIFTPVKTWEVVIPKSGGLHIHYTTEINWWARMWMRFIGWDVRKCNED